MDQKQSIVTKTLYLELELVLDIYSLVFCNIRFYLDDKYRIFIQNKDVALLYGKTLSQGIEDVLNLRLVEKNCEEISIDEHVKNVIALFKDSSKSLKPTVPSIHVIKELKNDPNTLIKLFTYKEKNIIEEILTNKFIELVDDILTINDLIKIDTFDEDITMIVFGCMDYFKDFENIMASNQWALVYVPQPKNSDTLDSSITTFKSLDQIPFENYEFAKVKSWHEGSLLKVELNKQINSAELPFWCETIPIKTIELQGKVVDGYKRGSKELGVPTANLETCEDNSKLIDSLLPGVYCGTVQFITSESNHDELFKKYGANYPDKKLRTALSIGWNPSYDNSQRTIEAYILEEFDTDFYGEELRVEIKSYIRAESNYSSLDHLIMAIHNDIETTKNTISLS